MSKILDRARKVQRQTAVNATFWISLDLLQGLIAEIERLEHQVDVLRQEHLSAARKRQPAENLQEQQG